MAVSDDGKAKPQRVDDWVPLHETVSCITRRLERRMARRQPPRLERQTVRRMRVEVRDVLRGGTFRFVLVHKR